MKTVAIIALLITAGSAPAQAQKIYSYINDDGIKVYTNLGSDRREEPAPRAPGLPKHRYGKLIHEAAAKYGEDEHLVEAIIAVESGFNAKAVSTKNCKGLMQLHPDTARDYGVRDIFDPKQNIEAGVRHFSKLRERYEDVRLALAAYNAGPTAVDRHNGIPPYKETEGYVRKVMALYRPPDPQDDDRDVIYRVTLPDGRVLLTNVPDLRVEPRRSLSYLDPATGN